MSTTAPPPPGHRAAQSSAGPPAGFESLIRTGPPAKSGARIFFYGVPGIGKTTLGAYAPKPLVIMAKGEDGLVTLMQKRRVPEVARAQAGSWEELLGLIFWAAASGRFETLVLDGVSGFEQMCHEHVCEHDFDGDWSEAGFAAFQRGYEVSAREWTKLLAALDDVHAKGIEVILIGHSDVRKHSDPLGKDFDVHTPVLHRKLWATTKPWADAVIFGTTVSAVNKEGKGIGGTQRVLFTSNRDGHEAKNRYGLPERIDLPDDPAQNWPVLRAAMDKGDA